MQAFPFDDSRRGFGPRFQAGTDAAGNQDRSRPRRKRWRILELVAMIAGFAIFWPIGLAVLGWKLNWFGFGNWVDGKFGTNHAAFGNDDAHAPFSMWRCNGRNGGGDRRDGHQDSGNKAFDDWKKAEIARLQAEYDSLVARQREFEGFLAELRAAKDREEFDSFMRLRTARPDVADGQPPR